MSLNPKLGIRGGNNILFTGWYTLERTPLQTFILVGIRPGITLRIKSVLFLKIMVHILPFVIKNHQLSLWNSTKIALSGINAP